MYSEPFPYIEILLPNPRLERAGQGDTGLDIHAVGMEDLLAGVAYGVGNPVAGATLLCGLRTSRGPGGILRGAAGLGRGDLACLQGGDTFESIIAEVGILRVPDPALRGAGGLRLPGRDSFFVLTKLIKNLEGGALRPGNTFTPVRNLPARGEAADGDPRRGRVASPSV